MRKGGGGHFAQTTVFVIFKTCHYFKPVRPLAVWTFYMYITDRSNIRCLSKPPVPSDEQPKRGTRRLFSNTIDAHTHPAHTRSGQGSQFAASVVGRCARFEVHHCYGSRDMSIKNKNSGNVQHAPLFSNLVIYDNYVCMLSCFDQECNNSKLFNAHHALASLPCKHEGGIIQHMEERDQLGQKSLKKCNANRRHKEPLES